MVAALPRSAAAIAKAFTGAAPRAAHRAGAPRPALLAPPCVQSLGAQRRHLPRPAQALPELLPGDLQYDQQQVDAIVTLYFILFLPQYIMTDFAFTCLKKWWSARQQPPASGLPAQPSAEQPAPLDTKPLLPPAPAGAQHPSADDQLMDISLRFFQEFVTFWLAWMTYTVATLQDHDSRLTSLESQAGSAEGDVTDVAAEG